MKQVTVWCEVGGCLHSRFENVEDDITEQELDDLAEQFKQDLFDNSECYWSDR